MQQIFKDWSTYIIGVPTILISFLVSLFIYNRQKRSKRLEYEVLVNYNMFDIREDIKEKISISYKQEKAENLRLIIVKLLNTGNVPILKSDFDKEIQITFDESTKLIDAEVYEKRPENIDIRIEQSSNGFSIFPCLINSKDYFIIRIIIDSSKEDFSILSRIAGIDKISKSPIVESHKTTNIFVLFTLSLFLGLLITLVANSLFDKLMINYHKNIISTITVFCMSILLVITPFMLIPIIRNKKPTNQ